MKFVRLLFVVVFVLAAALPATAGDRKLLYFNPKPVAGLGATLGKTYHGTGNVETHLSVGATLFSLDKAGHVGFLGVDTAVNFYDFSLNDSAIHDASRADGGYWGMAGYYNVVGTIIPVRIGPLAYQFSWNGHVRSLGVDRGRLHMITLDVLGLLRLYK